VAWRICSSFGRKRQHFDLVDHLPDAFHAFHELLGIGFDDGFGDLPQEDDVIAFDAE
jgi:hypothetical protein